MRRKKTSYYKGRLKEAHHPTTGQISVGDRVKERGSQKLGTIEGITHANFGQGRPVANVLWDDGQRSNEPLGRLKRWPEK